ncbi:hypothetical protein L1283_005405 [Sphingobacterium sp. HSC-15S19]
MLYTPKLNLRFNIQHKCYQKKSKKKFTLYYKVFYICKVNLTVL